MKLNGKSIREVFNKVVVVGSLALLTGETPDFLGPELAAPNGNINVTASMDQKHAAFKQSVDEMTTSRLTPITLNVGGEQVRMKARITPNPLGSRPS